MIKSYDLSGNVSTDHLGSTRLAATAAGVVKDSVSYYPFGDRIPYSGTSSDNHYGFTGLQDDGDSTYATFRNLNRNWGRWLTPDLYAGSYDFTDPQSLNRYSYVGNNPLNFTDPLGLEEDEGCASDDDTNCQIGYYRDQNGNYYYWNGSYLSPYNPINVNVDRSYCGPGCTVASNFIPFNYLLPSLQRFIGGAIPNKRVCSAVTPSYWPHGIGVVGGAEITAGSGSGGTIQGSAGKGWFSSPTGGVNSGWFSSFIAAGRLGPWVAASSPQGGEGSPLPLFAGAVAGLGAGLMATNAEMFPNWAAPLHP